MWKLSNLIPEAITDGERLQTFIRGFKLVPYAGSSNTTTQRLLNLLFDFAELSPSTKALLSSLDRYCYLTPIWTDLDGTKLEGERSKEFDSALQSLGLSRDYLNETVQTAFHHRNVCGNGYVRRKVEKLQSGGFIYSLHNDDPRDLAFIIDKPGEIFRGEGLREGDTSKKFQVLPLSTNPVGIDSEEMVFHLKIPGYREKYYGRTPFNLYWQAVEYFTGEMMAKVSRAEITAKSILYFETPFGAENPAPTGGANCAGGANPLEGFAEQLREMTTNEGEGGSGLVVGFYPRGTAPPIKMDFEISRDTTFLKFLLETASEYIFSSFGYPKQLAGIGQFRSGIGGNVVLDSWVIAERTVIQPQQRKSELFVTEILNDIAATTGLTLFENVRLLYPSLVTDLVEELKFITKATASTTSLVKINAKEDGDAIDNG